MAASVYIVEDHPVMQEMLREFLVGMLGMSVIGSSQSAEDALRDIPQEGIDIALIDMALPDMSGAQLIGELRDRRPSLPCLVLSGHGERMYIDQALRAGAKGYVLKGDFDELGPAIEKVLGSGTYISNSIGDHR